MKIALIQFQSSSDLDRNLFRLKQMTTDAKAKGAELVVFPEMAYFTGKKSEAVLVASQYERVVAEFQSWAKNLKIELIPGSIREPSDCGKFFNTLIYINKLGQIEYKYRKIFLFKAVLPDKTYDEGEYCVAGNEIVVSHTPIKYGFSICFDLRFPEVYRMLRAKGAQIIFLPSAFTVPTGQAHWETLIRARAIENQCFMVAPGLTGKAGEGNLTYGHSLVVGPWGEILLQMDETEGLGIVDIDVNLIHDAEKKVSAWKCWREAFLCTTPSS